MAGCEPNTAHRAPVNTFPPEPASTPALVAPPRRRSGARRLDRRGHLEHQARHEHAPGVPHVGLENALTTCSRTSSTRDPWVEADLVPERAKIHEGPGWGVRSPSQ